MFCNIVQCRMGGCLRSFELYSDDKSWINLNKKDFCLILLTPFSMSRWESKQTFSLTQKEGWEGGKRDGGDGSTEEYNRQMEQMDGICAASGAVGRRSGTGNLAMNLNHQPNISLSSLARLFDDIINE